MQISSGKSYPLGATVTPSGVNFSLFSLHATQVNLLLYEQAGDVSPAQIVRLDPQNNRTFYYWHVFIKGLRAGQLYAYQVDGPFEPARGLRYDRSKVLVDPYARAVFYENYQRSKAVRYGEPNAPYAMKSVVVDPTDYDWEDDAPLNRPYADSLIYEMHVRGFTAHPSSGIAPELRGTYAGLVEKIPYLQELGIKIVELMPVQQFDPQSAPGGRTNYWGYEPVAYFAPHREYSACRDALGPVNEFRQMVKALHRAGIEVILDVVYNHTAEDDQNGPTLSLRGLENSTYYMLNPSNPAEYLNYSGVGNTINANISIVRRMILDSLRYWVEHMHVDGFRFDLASVLSRGIDGELHPDPPILWAIESDPVLAGTKIIAEAWDAGGLYQVDSFVGLRWAVWNGQYRDSVRRFVRGDKGIAKALAEAVTGSPNIFPHHLSSPVRSINFVTCHDGFTLNDLVSYNEKHNEANGYNNSDGANDNYSSNSGVEGPTENDTVARLRSKLIRNFLTILMFSQGYPMLLMGDEVRRTQGGNNNAFNQDNETSWLDWEYLAAHADLLRFVRLLIRFRQASCMFKARLGGGVPPLMNASSGTEIHWHGVRLNQPDLSESSHSLAFELINRACGEHLFVLLNAYLEPLQFDLPQLAPGLAWRRLLDTSRQAPQDFCDPPAALGKRQAAYRLEARASAVLVAAKLD